ncbi:MAG: hypothetical protein HOC23_04565 [Halieaceae bacterium]|jgi:hypothetical protein|nr:hypothetical protein [Halieaceae bacterium]
MQHCQFNWSSEHFEHSENGVGDSNRLTVKALGVVYKHFLVPLTNYDLMGWYKYDHYGHHVDELKEDTGDEVWIKPWIVGHWLGPEETVFVFEPDEFMEEALDSVKWAEVTDRKHRNIRGSVHGFHFCISRKERGWGAVFSFRFQHSEGAKKLGELPLTEALCLSINGDKQQLEDWLDWAYMQG